MKIRNLLMTLAVVGMLSSMAAWADNSAAKTPAPTNNVEGAAPVASQPNSGSESKTTQDKKVQKRSRRDRLKAKSAPATNEKSSQ